MLELRPNERVILPGQMSFIDVVAVVTGDDLVSPPSVAAYNVRLNVIPPNSRGVLTGVAQGLVPLS